ncbi:hypothetical protein [Kineococcus auxinigenes]|uniref:hypothetical protein n=1 Tax=unclassified Kineococcus TaxID=2621656 RepID=UPI003D7C6A20
MGLLDRLLGRRPKREQWAPAPPAPHRAPQPAHGGAAGVAAGTDEAAIARYRYMLRTAPPDQVEQAHAEAFAKLTPEQRRQVLEQLSAVVPASELRGDDATSLARTATRAEVRRPGTLVQVFNSGPGYGGGYGGGYGRGFGGGGFGVGMGTGLGGSLLAGVAGAFVGTAIADALIPDDFGNEHFGDDQAYEAGEQAGYDEGYDDGSGAADGGYDEGAGGGYGDGYGDGGGDFGGGFGDGGDFGGDFGGDVEL